MTAALLLLASIGAVTVLALVIRFLSFIKQHFLTSHSYADYVSKWAVVTGASSGIGAGFVHCLASRKINVILLARSKDKMDALASSVTSKHGISTRVIQFDFSSATASDYVKLQDELQPLCPQILINNVGVNVEMPTEFVDMCVNDIERIVHVNISSINKMTSMLLPAMRKAGQGIVINMSSGGGVVSPAPLLAVYAGTKAYADAFALGLSGEVKDDGVLVCSMTPFFVESAMAKMRKSLSVPSAQKFADCALKQVGCGPRVNAYWVHEIMGDALKVLPLKTQVQKITDLHRSIRKRALRKKEKLAKKN